MFIRDSSGNPNQISKIFVRDSVGTPNEISKIYIRDASGTPILVFDNTATVFECANCDVGVAYYYTIGTAVPNGSYPFYSQPRSIFHTTCISTPAVSVDSNTGFLPVTQIDKHYWSRIGMDYDYITFNKPTEETAYYYTTELTFSNNGSSPFEDWLDNITTTGSVHFQTGNRLYPKLLEAFFVQRNYPPIPGYIITDYQTRNKKSTVWSMANFTQVDWTIHGTSADIDSFFDVCGAGVLNAKGVYESGTGVATRNTNIYPMYDRVVWLDKNKIKLPNTLNQTWFCSEISAMCGQQPCIGLYGDFYVNWAVSNCSSLGPGYGWQFFLYGNQPTGTPWNFSSCNPLDGDSSNNNDTSGWEDHSGSTSLDTGGETFCISWTSGEPFCIDIDCKWFFGGNGYEWSAYDSVNPYTWLLAKDKSNTVKTNPCCAPGADSNDCCDNCFYGAVDGAAAVLDGPPDICRNVYQIPPINSLDPQNQKFAYLSEYGSDQDMEPSGGIASGVAFNTAQDPSTLSSVARIKHVLPAYVTLSNNLIGKVIKMKDSNTTIQSFINSGPNSFETSGETPYFELPTYDGANGSLNEDDFSIWKAISSFLGFSLKDAVDTFTEPLPQKYRTYISSTSFYYEENRFDINARLSSSGHPSIPPKGIASATDASSIGQYPLLWWNFNGFPTEKHTHYVVVDMEFESATACQSYLNGGMRQIQNLHNLRKMIKSIQFHPLHMVSKRLKGKLALDTSVTPNVQRQVTFAFRHPVFENYMVSDFLQNAPDVFTNTSNSDIVGGNGFIDYYANGTETTPTADQGGTGGEWLTTSDLQVNRQPLFKSFQFGVGTTTPKTMWHSCLTLPQVSTYSDFLSKYYAAGTLVT
jgi:hypothetical protein